MTKSKYDEYASAFQTAVLWLLNILPDTVDAGVRAKCQIEIIKTFQHIERMHLYKFCEEHNYCPQCGDGGWDCEYHAHKR